MNKSIIWPLYIVAAALLWSLAGVCVKYVPWQPLSIASVRGTVAAVTIGCVRRKWRVSLTPATLLAALCMNFTAIFFMFANKLTTAANAVVLQYTAPVYVILLSIFVLKMRPRPVDIVTTVLAFTGVSMFFFDHLGHGALLGDCLAMLSGLSFAGVFFFNSLPGSDPEDASFLGCMFSALLLPTLFFDPQVIAGGAVPWLLAVFMGIFQLGFGYYFFSKGIRQTGAVTASIICAAEPILNPVWVYLIVGERPGALSIAGAALVIAVICFYNVVSAKRATSLNPDA